MRWALPILLAAALAGCGEGPTPEEVEAAKYPKAKPLTPEETERAKGLSQSLPPGASGK